MTIDPESVKPGDTVRVRYHDEYMMDAGIEPHEPPQWLTVYLYGASRSPFAGGYAISDRDITILEHIPARPDWADALVVRDEAGFIYLREAAADSFIGRSGERWTLDELEPEGPITVVLDADGNPPTAEVEWLDADALDKLPTPAVIIPPWRGLPWWKKAG